MSAETSSRIVALILPSRYLISSNILPVPALTVSTSRSFIESLIYELSDAPLTEMLFIPPSNYMSMLPCPLAPLTVMSPVEFVLT